MRPVIFYNNRAHPTSSRLAAAAVRPQMIVFNFLIRYNYYNTYISDVNLFLILQQFRPHYSQNCTNALTLAEQLLYISSTFCAIIHLTQLLYCVYRKRQIGGKRDEAFTGRTQK